MAQKPAWFTAFIFWMQVEGVIKVMMIFNQTLRQTKFPGGSHKGDRDPLETGLREIKEEVFEDEVVNMDQLRQAELMLGAEIEKSPDHTQYFYCVEWNPAFGKIRSSIRTERDERLKDEKGRPTQTEYLAAPHWVELKHALLELFPPHRKALRDAIGAMCTDPKVFDYVQEHCPQALPVAQ